MAAYKEAGKQISVPANTDLSTKQYYIMTINSSGKLAVCNATTRPAGVLQDNPAAADRPGALQIEGVTKVICGGSFNPGDNLVSDANGAAIVQATDTSARLGVAMEAGASGKLAPMLIQPTGANQV